MMSSEIQNQYLYFLEVTSFRQIFDMCERMTSALSRAHKKAMLHIVTIDICSPFYIHMDLTETDLWILLFDIEKLIVFLERLAVRSVKSSNIFTIEFMHPFSINCCNAVSQIYESYYLILEGASSSPNESPGFNRIPIDNIFCHYTHGTKNSIEYLPLSNRPKRLSIQDDREIPKEPSSISSKN
ncbi:hypothetical protein FF38_00077 [Lucilia cuprina]|uniref:Uncharacterized protein n=1 Tax=Lucilia cuprina TaxID=7375 RepID=A0A0L0BND9_LUCCU|nr:hypothetical protein FF38_00077 [Lucilia cuprina]